MPEQMREARSQVGVEGDHPLFIDAGTAPDNPFSAVADEHRRTVHAVRPGASSARDVSTVVERVADTLTSAGVVDGDTESQTSDAVQTVTY